MANTDPFGDLLGLAAQLAMGGDPPGKVSKRDFKHAGFKCAIRGGFAGCGYVGVPKGHPWQVCGGYWNEPLASIDIHGGVTYAKWGDGKRLSKRLFWIGFDTAHFNSAGVNLETETRRLAEQARDATKH